MSAPSSAASLLSWLTAAATRRQRRYFPQHLYFALHAHAAWFGILCVPAILRLAHQADLAAKVSLIAAAAIAVYTAIAVRTVYGKTWFRSALQAGVTLFGYGSILVFTMVILFIALALGDL